MNLPNFQCILNKQEAHRREVLREYLNFILSDETILHDIKFYLFVNDLNMILESDTIQRIINSNSKWQIVNIITEIILTSLDCIE